MSALLYSRKFKAFSLNNQQMLELLSGKAKAVNLPDDAEMLAVNWDHWRDGWFLKIASDEYEEVREGYLCPELILECERI